jgi:hypothetical protein
MLNKISQDLIAYLRLILHYHINIPTQVSSQAVLANVVPPAQKMDLKIGKILTFNLVSVGCEYFLYFRIDLQGLI